MRRPGIVKRILEYASRYNEPFCSHMIMADFKADKICWTPQANQIGPALLKNGYEIAYTVKKVNYWQKKKSENNLNSDSNYPA